MSLGEVSGIFKMASVGVGPITAAGFVIAVVVIEALRRGHLYSVDLAVCRAHPYWDTDVAGAALLGLGLAAFWSAGTGEAVSKATTQRTLTGLPLVSKVTCRVKNDLT